MRVWREGTMFKGAHITGPTHNSLVLDLAEDSDGAECPVTVLPPLYPCEHRLKGEEVSPWITAGVARANGELGTRFRVVYAAVVEDDTPLARVYSELARRIVLAASEERREPPAGGQTAKADGRTGHQGAGRDRG